VIEVLIADDHPLVSKGMQLIIESQSGMKVVARVSDGQTAYDMTGKLYPDIVLLDISMPPGESGIVIAGKIHADYPKTKVIMFTMHDDKEYLLYTMQVGASGYILKSSSEEELIEAIRTVHAGGVYVCKEMVPYLVQGFVNRHKEEKEGYLKLSERETQVLTLIAKGYGNKQIGEILFISVKTVESYKSKIMNKLGLKTRPELVEYALKKRLIQY
jgi:two-component system response regulator NreC